MHRMKSVSVSFSDRPHTLVVIHSARDRAKFMSIYDQYDDSLRFVPDDYFSLRDKYHLGLGEDDLFSNRYMLEKINLDSDVDRSKEVDENVDLIKLVESSARITVKVRLLKPSSSPNGSILSISSVKAISNTFTYSKSSMTFDEAVEFCRDSSIPFSIDCSNHAQGKIKIHVYDGSPEDMKLRVSDFIITSQTIVQPLSDTLTMLPKNVAALYVAHPDLFKLQELAW